MQAKTPVTTHSRVVLFGCYDVFAEFSDLVIRLDKSIRYVKNHKAVLQRFAEAQSATRPRQLIAIGGTQRWYAIRH